MRRKFVIALALMTLLSSASVIYGCGSNTTNNTTNNKDGVKDVGKDIKYTAINFKDDIVNAGHDLKESAETHWDKFKGNETDYYAGDKLVRVYEYDSKDALNADVARISSDGLSVDGEVVYTEKPHYYTNGNTLIVYEGNDQSYINEFNTRYGNPII